MHLGCKSVIHNNAGAIVRKTINQTSFVNFGQYMNAKQNVDTVQIIFFLNRTETFFSCPLCTALLIAELKIVNFDISRFL